jgi:hypothetical protein
MSDHSGIYAKETAKITDAKDKVKPIVKNRSRSTKLHEA